MRYLHKRYATVLACMMAAGTWILPVKTLAVAAPIAPDDDASAAAAATGLAEHMDELRVSGEFDLRDFTFESADLNGDGFEDTIEVTTPKQLVVPGSIRVIDGGSSEVLYELQSSVNEIGFGRLSSLMPDCDGDGGQEIAVFSWMYSGDQLSSGPMEMRIRVFGGATGQLLGLLTATRDFGKRLTPDDYTVVVAGDVNTDGELTAEDVIATSIAVGVEAGDVPAADCDADSNISMGDVAEITQRVSSLSARDWWERVKMQLESYKDVDEILQIVPPGSETDPDSMGGGGGTGTPPCIAAWRGGFSCWIELAQIIGDFTLMAVGMAKCAGPLVTICIIEAICNLTALINDLIQFVHECFTNGNCLPEWLQAATEIIDIVTILCGRIGDLTDEMKVRIGKFFRDVLRGLGGARI